LAVIPLLYSPRWRVTQSQHIQASLQIPQVSLIFIGLTAILCLQWLLDMLHSSQYALTVLSYFIWAFFLVVIGSHLRREFGWEKLASSLAWCLVGVAVCRANWRSDPIFTRFIQLRRACAK
jgi:hypothetical protein